MRKKTVLSERQTELVKKVHNCLMPMFRSRPGWPQNVTRSGKAVVAAIVTDCIPGVTHSNIKKLFKDLTGDPIHAIKINRGRFLLGHKVYMNAVRANLLEHGIEVDLSQVKEPGISGLLPDGPEKERVEKRRKTLLAIEINKRAEQKERLRSIRKQR